MEHQQQMALLFPGQGSQYVGMGQSLINTPFEAYIDRADKILRYPLKKLMLKGPREDLTLTQNAQPAILAYSFALFKKLLTIIKSKNIAKVLGHSVGEYTALVAAGPLSYDDALLAVYERGRYMQEAVHKEEGAMYAILKVPQEVIEMACRKIEGAVVANYNSPEQIVISGKKESCEKIVGFIKDQYKNNFKAIKLNVSAPFHSFLMESAADKLNRYLKSVLFKPNKIPYIANVDAHEYLPQTTGEVIRQNLYKQICGSVLWTQSFQALSSELFCLECGPKAVLTGLAKKIQPKISVLPLDREESFGKLL